MIATLTHSAKETPAALPACPHCNSSDHVRKAGYGGRHHIPQYRCVSSQCAGKWFLHPDRVRTHRVDYRKYRKPLSDEIAFCLTAAEKPKFEKMLEHRRKAEPERTISAGEFAHEMIAGVLARADAMRREHRRLDIWSIEAIEK
jgi:hypothetical protein